jgi:hypothetical protein
MRDELVLLLSEEEVGDSILRLAEIGLAASIHPHLAADAETVALIERVDEIRDRVAPGTERWRLRLAVLARRLPPEELFDWFLALKLRRRDAERIADAVALSPRLLEQLETVTEAADAQRLIAPHDPEGAILALASAKPGVAANWLERYFEELRRVELEISGVDLAALGLTESPRVGEVLDELLRRKLNGELDGRTAELDAARQLIGV